MRRYLLLIAFVLYFAFSSLAQEDSAYNRALQRILEAEASNSTRLDLSNMYLSSIPPELWELQQLVFLNLSYNNLTALPPEIGQLTNLNQLWIRNNQLSTLPPEIGNLSRLRDLDLHYNNISSLPAEFANLSNMEYLQIGNNPLSLPSRIEQLSVRGDDAAVAKYLSDPTGYYLWRYGSLLLLVLILLLLGFRFHKFLPFALGAVIGGIGGAVGGLLLTLFLYLFGQSLGYLVMIFTPFLPFEDTGILFGTAIGLWIAFVYSLRQRSIMQRKQKALQMKNAHPEEWTFP